MIQLNAGKKREHVEQLHAHGDIIKQTKNQDHPKKKKIQINKI